MNRLKTLIAVQIFLAAPIAATAHNAEEHAREAAQNREGPHCAALKDMTQGKRDANDPVMQAMMLKCSASNAHQDMPMPEAQTAPESAHPHGALQ